MAFITTIFDKTNNLTTKSVSLVMFTCFEAIYYLGLNKLFNPKKLCLCERSGVYSHLIISRLMYKILICLMVSKFWQLLTYIVQSRVSKTFIFLFSMCLLHVVGNLANFSKRN